MIENDLDPDSPEFAWLNDKIFMLKEYAKGKSKEDKENYEKMLADPQIKAWKARIEAQEQQSTPPIPPAPPTQEQTNPESEQPKGLLELYEQTLLVITVLTSKVTARKDRIYLANSIAPFLENRIKELKAEPKTNWIDKL